MGELRAFCPVCHLLLDGDLVASKCNHVFHRACLTADTVECPKCREKNISEAPLDIYGLSFNKASLDPGAAAVARQVADRSGGVNIREKHNMKNVIELCVLRQDVKKRHQSLDELCDQLKDAEKYAELQLQRLRGAERGFEKRANEAQRLEEELQEYHKTHESLCKSVNDIRNRDTVLEYWLMLGNKNDDDNLAFLTKMVTMVKDPGGILTEVARLRDYHRNRLAKRQKEGAALTRCEARVRRELNEQQHLVVELEKKLNRIDSLRQSNQRPSINLPVAKYPRLSSFSD